MHRLFTTGVLAILCTFALSACAVANPSARTAAPPPTTAPTAEPTRARPTSTPAPTAVPPTAEPTALPPTAEPTPTPAPAVAASAASIEERILQAFEHTSTAESYRMDLDVSMHGVDPATLGFAGAQGDRVSLLAMSGSFNGEDAHFTMSGFFAAFMGGDMLTGIEFMVVDGQTYIHGPLPTMGAPENRWYIADPADSSFTQSQFDSGEVLGALDQQDMSMLNMLQHGGVEELDGRKCDVYVADKEATIAAIGSLNSDLGASDIDQVENAEIKFWLCDDGYFHQMHMLIEGYTEEMPNQLAGMTMFFHIYDYGADIQIVAPVDALPLDQSSLDMTVPFDFGITPPPEGGLTATVFNGGNIRSEPSLNGAVLGQLHAGQIVTLQEKTADGSWYAVVAPEATGWVNASLLTIDPAVAAQVPVAGQPAQEPAGLTATVFNGGNLRAAPNLQSDVLDQIHAHETVQLLAKTPDGAWYQIVNPRGVTGWVNASLLTIDPAVAAQVPAG